MGPETPNLDQEVKVTQPIEKAEEPKNTITVMIADESGFDECNFWIGFFKKGVTEPLELSKSDKTKETLNIAMNEGINESQPLMISNSQAEPPRFIYLVPIPDLARADTAQVSSVFVKTVKSLRPKKVGVYFVPGKNSGDNLLIFLQEVLFRCAQETGTREFYLYPGKHGLNSILNTAHYFKKQMEEKKVGVYVYH